MPNDYSDSKTPEQVNDIVMESINTNEKRIGMNDAVDENVGQILLSEVKNESKIVQMPRESS